MNKLNILIITDNNDVSHSIFKITPDHIQSIKNIYPETLINLVNDNNKDIERFLNDVQIIIHSSGNLNNIDLNKAKKLIWIHSTNAGVNGIVQSLKKSNIILTNSSGVHPIPISEHVFALILFLTRKINQAYKNQLSDKKWRQSGEYYDVEELNGKTVGIVGFGQIGKQIGIISTAFGMKILTQTSENDEKHLKIILNKSDFIINCLPLTNKTSSFFNQEMFNRMKPTAYFINIGRGQTVVEKELIFALENKIIAGAGLDVFEHEPLDSSSKLWNLPNVIITPHYAGFNPHYNDRMIQIFIKNLIAFINKKPLPNLVDKNKEY
ncbi:MAG: D-2-hydroxyacid dehydrogenase [bacterium]|nr:D-2-hydroxyacid dehydrogenase [bacterium]